MQPLIPLVGHHHLARRRRHDQLHGAHRRLYVDDALRGLVALRQAHEEGGQRANRLSNQSEAVGVGLEAKASRVEVLGRGAGICVASGAERLEERRVEGLGVQWRRGPLEHSFDEGVRRGSATGARHRSRQRRGGLRARRRRQLRLRRRHAR